MFLGLDSATWAALGVWAQVLVIGVSAWLVWRQVNEARRLREVQTQLHQEQMRPYVVASVQVEQGSMLMITIENIGATPAFDVDVELDPSPDVLLAEAPIQMLEGRTPQVPPGHVLRTYWDTSFRILGDDYDAPTAFTATVSYRDSNGDRYGPDTYVLDARAFDGQATALKGLHELASSIEDLLKEHKKWTDDLTHRGIRANIEDRDRRVARDGRASMVRYTRRAFARDGLRGAVRQLMRVVRARMHRWGP